MLLKLINLQHFILIINKHEKVVVTVIKPYFCLIFLNFYYINKILWQNLHY